MQGYLQLWFSSLYSYGQYKFTAASLGIDKMKKLVKTDESDDDAKVGEFEMYVWVPGE